MPLKTDNHALSGGMKSMFVLRQERDAAICDALRAGKPAADVAALFGISQQYATLIGYQAGVRPARISKQKRDAAIAEAVKSGSTVAEICQKFGVRAATVSIVRKTNGLPPCKRPDLPPPEPRRHKQTDQIIEAVLAGDDVPSVARRFKLSRVRIYQIAARYAIPCQRKKSPKSDAIAELISAGKTAVEIAAAVDRSIATVYTVARNRRLTLKKAPRTSGSFAILADVLNTSHTMGEIAERHATTAGSVAQVINRARAAGIKIPSRRGNGWRKNGSKRCR